MYLSQPFLFSHFFTVTPYFCIFLLKMQGQFTFPSIKLIYSRGAVKQCHCFKGDGRYTSHNRILSMNLDTTSLRKHCWTNFSLTVYSFFYADHIGLCSDKIYFFIPAPFFPKKSHELKINIAKYSLILYYLAKVEIVDDLLSKVWTKFENYLRFSLAET